MTRIALVAALSLGLAAPAMAQHADHVMPQAPAAKQPATPAPLQPAATPADHQGHDSQPTPPPADPHAGHVMDMDAVDPPDAGNDVPPDAPTDFAADAFFPRDAMARARGILDKEHGGAWQSKIMANILEYQSQNGEDGYRWEGEAWFGGDLDRLVIKSEGEGSKDIDGAEV